MRRSALDVVRYSDNDVHEHLDAVLEDILRQVEQRLAPDAGPGSDGKSP